MPQSRADEKITRVTWNIGWTKLA